MRCAGGVTLSVSFCNFRTRMPQPQQGNLVTSLPTPWGSQFLGRPEDPYREISSFGLVDLVIEQRFTALPREAYFGVERLRPIF